MLIILTAITLTIGIADKKTIIVLPASKTHVKKLNLVGIYIHNPYGYIVLLIMSGFNSSAILL